MAWVVGIVQERGRQYRWSRSPARGQPAVKQPSDEEGADGGVRASIDWITAHIPRRAGQTTVGGAGVGIAVSAPRISTATAADNWLRVITRFSNFEIENLYFFAI